MSRHSRFQLPLILCILLVAAGLRIVNLTRLPPGFSDEEIKSIQVAQTALHGTVASLYNVGDPAGGYEGLYPVLQALTTSLIGDGLLGYRVLPLWCGLLSIALMYALSRRLFGDVAGLGAVVAMTVSLWPVLLARSAIRETLLLTLTLAMLLTLARALHLGRTISPDTPLTVPYTVLGVLLIAMIYTHWTGWLGIPLFIGFLAYLIANRQPISRRVLSFSGFTMLVTIILGIPYLVFSLRAFSLSGLHVFWTNRPENPGTLISSIFRTLVSLFIAGDPRPYHNLPGAPLVGPVGAVLLLIGLVVAIRRWRTPNMLLMLLALVIGLLPGIWSRGETNFANIVLALPPIMALIGVGTLAVAQQVSKASTLTVDRRTLALGVVAVAVSVWFLNDTLFFRWASSIDVDRAYHGRLGRLAAYLDRVQDNLTTSICTLNLNDNEGGKVSDPVLLDLMMHRKSADIRFSNCMTGLVLTRGGALQRFAYADMAAEAITPPIFRAWLDKGKPVSADGLPPGAIITLDVEKELADVSGKMTLGHVEWAQKSIGPAATASLPVRMGGYLTFQGYQMVSGPIYNPGDTFRVVTFWRADGPQEPDLRIFVHVLRNPNTEPVVQNDLLSVEPSLLQDRDVFIQIISIPLPPEFPSGEYSVSIGAYRSQRQTRLPVYDANYERGDRLFLDTITVADK